MWHNMLNHGLQCCIPYQSADLPWAVLFPVHLPANALGKAADDDPSIWALSSHKVDFVGVPNFWLWFDPALVVGAIW